jgi:hypothetical protein
MLCIFVPSAYVQLVLLQCKPSQRRGLAGERFLVLLNRTVVSAALATCCNSSVNACLHFPLLRALVWFGVCKPLHVFVHRTWHSTKLLHSTNPITRCLPSLFAGWCARPFSTDLCTGLPRHQPAAQQ